MLNFGQARDAADLAERALNRRQELYFSARRREVERKMGMEPYTLTRDTCRVHDAWERMVREVEP